MNSVIIKPLITEKTMTDAEKGKYSFIVAEAVGKKVIRKAIENAFSVNVRGIMTTTVKGKRKHIGKNRREVAVSSFKKAIVQLKTGQKIGLFELGA